MNLRKYLIIAVCLLSIPAGIHGKCATKVELKANMPWANSDRKSCKQISSYGSVSSKSQKNVSWVQEYRGIDGQWHYQKPENMWNTFSPGTSVPTLTGKLYTKCDQRLQLNPKGKGDAGKGGIATGYMNVVR